MMELTDNDAICGKYDSPLDHMQNSISDSKPDVRCVLSFYNVLNSYQFWFDLKIVFLHLALRIEMQSYVHTI